MSVNMKEEAAWEASFLGTVSKQIFHHVPKIPSEVSLRGKTALITGSSSGLGLECARQFLQIGAQRVILAVRSQLKGDAAAKKLLAEHPKADVQLWILDMESYESVRNVASRCKSLDRLDVVVLNAGGGRSSFRRCEGEGGREVTLQVNYLATILLAILLVPILKAKNKGSPEELKSSSPGRLTIVGSGMAFRAKLEQPSGSLIDALDTEVGFHGMGQYGITKLLLPMFISKLAEIVDPDDIIINVVNPSAVRGTDLMRDSKDQYLVRAFVLLSSLLLGRNLVDGTRQYLHSALVLGAQSHGSFTDFQIRPYPPYMYTDVGQAMTDKLWDDTLRELGIPDIEAAM